MTTKLMRCRTPDGKLVFRGWRSAGLERAVPLDRDDQLKLQKEWRRWTGSPIERAKVLAWISGVLGD